jgi:hypothetical protein
MGLFGISHYVSFKAQYLETKSWSIGSWTPLEKLVSVSFEENWKIFKDTILKVCITCSKTLTPCICENVKGFKILDLGQITLAPKGFDRGVLPVLVTNIPKLRVCCYSRQGIIRVDDPTFDEA